MIKVYSITQKGIPIAEVNKPVIIEFDFDTDGSRESTGARLEALVINDSIITDMSYHVSVPESFFFVSSVTKKEAIVLCTNDNDSGWPRANSITLQFTSLPTGNSEYIVGTLYYYFPDRMIGPGIPLVVKLYG